MTSKLTSEALAELALAKRQLESTDIAVRLADAVGKPIERGLDMLPDKASELLNDTVRKAIEKALELAIKSIDQQSETKTPATKRLHRWLAAGSGAVGGAFGFAGFALELPVSTGLILRSIAEIARSQGENLETAETRLACVEVFAYGSPTSSPRDEAAETGYFAMRQVLAATVSQAASHIAKHGLSGSGAPALARFVSAIAARFSVTAGKKLAAQLIPIVGALGGAAINTVFIDHFQKIAAGHFTVRRLERQFGPETVRKAYESLGADALPPYGGSSKN